ncbi:MAG TPA: RDD family protein [Burkholderiales bacterium]|nr:RDD family protein [Burkholderiales bacterium]
MASSWSSSPDYAGFWPRAAAALIDALIVVVILGPLVALLGPRTWDLAGFLAVAAAVIGFWRTCGATPGKIALGVKIVDAATGGPPTLGRLVLRFLAYFVSALPLYLGFLWAAFDRRKQSWHDKIARTVVINSED